MLLKQLDPMQVCFPRCFAVMHGQKEPSLGTENVKSMNAPSEQLLLPTGFRFLIASGPFSTFNSFIAKGSRMSRSYNAEIH